MTDDKTSLVVDGPLRYNAEPVGYSPSFAHVLDVPESEDIWPGDAVELFQPAIFARRLVLNERVYRRNGLVFEHMRREYHRLCFGTYSLDDLWAVQFVCDCYVDKGSFPEPMFGTTDLDDDLFVEDVTEGLFCDGSDDADEPDTMNSELLLTEVYLGPEELTLDRLEKHTHLSLSPRRRVDMFSPIERKDKP